MTGYHISGSDVGYRLKWWGHKIWFSHHVIQHIVKNGMAIGPSLAILNGLLQHAGVPGKLSSIVLGFIGLSIYWFVKQDRGAGVVVQWYWTSPTVVLPRFVPGYQG